MRVKGRYNVSGLTEAQFEPGSDGKVLRNLVGIINIEEMEIAEANALAQAMDNILRQYHQEHRFTADDICFLHKSWLGEIYEWAGQYRQVNISKGGFPFAMAAQVPKLMNQLEEKHLKKYTPLHLRRGQRGRTGNSRGPYGTGAHPSISGRKRSGCPHAGDIDGIAGRVATAGLQHHEPTKGCIFRGRAGGA